VFSRVGPDPWSGWRATSRCATRRGVNAAHFINREGHRVVDVALHEPLETVENADHLDALEAQRDGGGR